MKKLLLISALFALSFNAFSQEETQGNEVFEVTLKPEYENEQPKLAEKPEVEYDYTNKFHLVFDEGVVLGCVNRLQNQEGRSNFNWRDSFVGAYFTVHLNNLFTFDVLARTEVFYPFLHTFNGMEVFPKQTLLYGFDELVGIDLRFNKFKYFTLNVVPGLHLMYELSDEYHLFYFGGGAIVGAELPVAKKWTVLVDGTFTCDYPNIGSNHLVQPFNLSWQWQTSIGVRYSKKMTNKYNYIDRIKEKKETKGN